MLIDLFNELLYVNFTVGKIRSQFFKFSPIKLRKKFPQFDYQFWDKKQ